MTTLSFEIPAHKLSDPLVIQKIQELQTLLAPKIIPITIPTEEDIKLNDDEFFRENAIYFSLTAIGINNIISKHGGDYSYVKLNKDFVWQLYRLLVLKRECFKELVSSFCSCFFGTETATPRTPFFNRPRRSGPSFSEAAIPPIPKAEPASESPSTSEPEAAKPSSSESTPLSEVDFGQVLYNFAGLFKQATGSPSSQSAENMASGLGELISQLIEPAQSRQTIPITPVDIMAFREKLEKGKK